jgi:hypothetical protein
MVKFVDPNETHPDFKGQECGYANFHGWSDIQPCEIVRVVSDKCLEIRYMDAEQLHTPEDLGWVQGGFSFIATNNYQGQKWKITSNPKNRVFKIRRHKNGTWKGAHGSRHCLSDIPRKHYDYNF